MPAIKVYVDTKAREVIGLLIKVNFAVAALLYSPRAHYLWSGILDQRFFVRCEAFWRANESVSMRELNVCRGASRCLIAVEIEPREECKSQINSVRWEMVPSVYM